MNGKYKIILASQSPRRKEILENLGIVPEIKVSGADEKFISGMTPEDYVESVSFRKAISVIDGCGKDDIIIAADTVVCLDETIFGKPKNAEEAKRILGMLSGNVHKVITGFTIAFRDKTVVSHEVTEVKFRELTEDDVMEYVMSGEPLDKAGAYGIQDKAAVFVEGINGDYFNVVGLPVFRLFEVMRKEFGIGIFDIAD